MLELRPHHLNCIFFYRGKGYSKDFVKNMDQIIALLRENPLIQIKLTKTNDILCSHCPQKTEDICHSLDHIRQLDENTLKEYSLDTQTTYTFKELSAKLYHPLDIKKFEQICQSCEWYRQGVCSKETIEEQSKFWK